MIPQVLSSFISLVAATEPPSVRFGTFQDQGQSIQRVRYQVDTSSNRVKLLVELQFPTEGDEDGRGQVERAVPGLSYDAATREVRLQLDGTTSVCATLTHESLFGPNWHTLVATGRCEVVAKRQVIFVDDGLTLQPRRVQTFELVVKPDRPATALRGT